MIVSLKTSHYVASYLDLAAVQWLANIIINSYVIHPPTCTLRLALAISLYETYIKKSFF